MSARAEQEAASIGRRALTLLLLIVLSPIIIALAIVIAFIFAVALAIGILVDILQFGFFGTTGAVMWVANRIRGFGMWIRNVLMP